MIDYATMPELVEKMRRAREAAYLPGSQKGCDKLKADGKLNARERLDVLLDPGSFVELGRLATSTQHEFGMDRKRVVGDGIITGHGKIDGRMVCVYSQDSSVLGGSVGVWFLSSPSSVGSLGAARLAAGRGVAVFVFCVGFPGPSWAPLVPGGASFPAAVCPLAPLVPGGGAWCPVGAGPLAGAWRWVRA